MKIFNKLILFLLVIKLLSISLYAQEDPKLKTEPKVKSEVKTETQTKHGIGFVDKDGDGYNDNAPDHDGDGIPNGLDPDYNGKKNRKGFVDLDGDGINDNAAFGQGQGMKHGLNRNNGLDNHGKGPQSGNVGGMGNNPENSKGNQNRTSKGKGMGGH